MNYEKEQKLKVVVILLVFVTLVILVNLLKNINDKDEIWNYSEITSANAIISKGIKVNDREKYYILEDLVIRFLSASNEDTIFTIAEYGGDYGVTYSDFYDILTDDYKSFLSKKEFEEIANNFANKFITISAEGYKSIEANDIIKSMYLYGENKYLCVLISENNELCFLGIQLNEDSKSYNIFYVE